MRPSARLRSSEATTEGLQGGTSPSILQLLVVRMRRGLGGPTSCQPCKATERPQLHTGSCDCESTEYIESRENIACVEVLVSEVFNVLVAFDWQYAGACRLLCTGSAVGKSKSTTASKSKSINHGKSVRTNHLTDDGQWTASVRALQPAHG
jgi:hypothetical protein